MRRQTRRLAILTSALKPLTGEDTEPRDARNGARHVLALTASKLADGLVDPKLILSWLATSLGAPAALVGLLVPIRESGALLPQIVLSASLQRLRIRKLFWSVGAIGQSLCAGLIVAAALTLSGWVAGLAICAALAGLALSRAACSVSYKDVLGKTVEKTHRGRVTGLAGSVASVGVIVLAILLLTGVLRQQAAVIAAIVLAALLWLVAAVIMSRLEEEPSEPQSTTPLDLSPLRQDAQLRRFILVRGLLVPSALAPPYFVLLASDTSVLDLNRLGALVLVSALASFLSSYLWGRLADRSSRRVLMLAGILAGLAMAGAVLLSVVGLAGTIWAMPVTLFVLMLAYHGVRQGRSTYLVDMSPEDKRAPYAALANTVIGTLLLAVGALGGAAALLNTEAALLLFAGLCGLAAVFALRLDEVETEAD